MKQRVIEVVRGGETVRLHKPVYTTAGRWIRRGFTASEARELQYLSPNGRATDYVQMMIRHRTALYGAAVRYDWTPAQYRRALEMDYIQQGLRERRRFESYADYFAQMFYPYLNKWHEKSPNWPGGTPSGGSGRGHFRSMLPSQLTPDAKTRVKQVNVEIDNMKARINQAIRRNDQPERHRLERELDRLYAERG